MGRRSGARSRCPTEIKPEKSKVPYPNRAQRVGRGRFAVSGTQGAVWAPGEPASPATPSTTPSSEPLRHRRSLPAFRRGDNNRPAPWARATRSGAGHTSQSMFEALTYWENLLLAYREAGPLETRQPGPRLLHAKLAEMALSRLDRHGGEGLLVDCGAAAIRDELVAVLNQAGRRHGRCRREFQVPRPNQKNTIGSPGLPWQL